MVFVVDLILYLFFIKWIDLITSPFLYKIIITLYLLGILFLIKKILPWIIDKKKESVNNTFLISSIIGWIIMLLLIIWFLCNSS